MGQATREIWHILRSCQSNASSLPLSVFALSMRHKLSYLFLVAMFSTFHADGNIGDLSSPYFELADVIGLECADATSDGLLTEALAEPCPPPDVRTM
eukprot:3646877-Pyramimonas_sp.AAC.1